eukprot:154616-Pelagomonas_calceolata.AAC.2
MGQDLKTFYPSALDGVNVQKRKLEQAGGWSRELASQLRCPFEPQSIAVAIAGTALHSTFTFKLCCALSTFPKGPPAAALSQ